MPQSVKSPLLSPLLVQLQQRLMPFSLSTTIQPAAVLLAITNETQPKILYTLRSKKLNQHAGEVSFAGGKRDDNDTDNIATALRETFEETGILPEKVTILGELPVQYARSGLAVQPIVGLIPPEIELIPEFGEIERLFWGDLATLIHQPLIEYVLDYHGHRIQSPSFIIDNEVVWGLTGRITASLLTIGFDRQIDWHYQITPLT